MQSNFSCGEGDGMSGIDYGVILLITGIMLIIGKIASDRIFNNMDYLLAGRKVRVLPLGLSLSATDIGGASLVGGIVLSYKMGLSGAWWNFCAVPAWLILSLVLPKLYRQYMVTTVPEFLERKYDLKTRILASSLHLIGTIFTISAQTMVASLMIQTLTGWSIVTSFIAATIVFVIYTSLGGLIAVIWTDIFAYIIMISGIIAALITVIYKVGGISRFITQVPVNYWRIDQLGWSDPLGWVLMSIFWYTTSQYYVQRIFAAKDDRVSKNSFLFAGGTAIIFSVIVAFLGIGMYLINSNLGNDEMNIMQSLILQMPVGVRGLLLASVLVATMSTSSSYLNAGASLFTIDIYKRVIAPKATDLKCLTVARISSVVIGLISLTPMYFNSSVIDAIVFANTIFSASVFFPIIIGFSKLKTHPNSAFMAMIFGCLTAIGSRWVGSVRVFSDILHPILLCSLVSLLTMVIFQMYYTVKQRANNS